MLSNNAQILKEKVEIIYHQELSGATMRFNKFQEDINDILTALLIENEKLTNEVNRLNSLLDKEINNHKLTGTDAVPLR
ncbi:hypothetical protein [Planktothrix sp.]|uniref:hypothetical protein n=1 Tax=Planktothrix sp. TaxID=3088171 RepID=UPI0038D4B79B